jgi:hypothetical protein
MPSLLGLSPPPNPVAPAHMHQGCGCPHDEVASGLEQAASRSRGQFDRPRQDVWVTRHRDGTPCRSDRLSEADEAECNKYAHNQPDRTHTRQPDRSFKGHHVRSLARLQRTNQRRNVMSRPARRPASRCTGSDATPAGAIIAIATVNAKAEPPSQRMSARRVRWFGGLIFLSLSRRDIRSGLLGVMRRPGSHRSTVRLR